MMRRSGELFDDCDVYGRSPGVDGAQYNPRPPSRDRSDPNASPAGPRAILTAASMCSLVHTMRDKSQSLVSLYWEPARCLSAVSTARRNRSLR